MTEVTTTPANRARAAAGLAPANGGGAASKTEIAIANRSGRLRAMRDQYQLAMPRGYDADQLIRDAVTALRNTPELADCTEASFFGALMTAAQLGLRPNVSALGHGWILPFRNNRAGTTEATWILGYEGMVELAHRTKLVASITAKTVYANEPFTVRYGLNETLDHEPILAFGERGAPVAHYAICRLLNGGVAWYVMGEDEVDEIKSYSKTATRRDSPWNTNRNSMARKSAIRQLWKFIPRSNELALAIAADDTVRTDLDSALTVEAQSVAVVRLDDPDTDMAAEAPSAASGSDGPAAAPPTRERPNRAATRRAAVASITAKFGDRLPLAAQLALGYAPGTVDLDKLSTENLAALLDFDLDAATDAPPLAEEWPPVAEPGA